MIGKYIRIFLCLIGFIAVLISRNAAVLAAEKSAPGPQADLKAFQTHFKQQFPRVAFDDYVNGPYAMDSGMRAQWQQIMQFPPFDFELSDGKKLFNTAFANGQTYASCFPHGGIGVAQSYPYFDSKMGKVVTLDSAIQACRVINGEKPLDWSAGPLAEIAAYMVSTSQGKRFDVKVPNDQRAIAAYEVGKQYFYSRRGQLNFSCASCHVQAAGKRLRGDILAPALGLLAAFPIYRDTWGNLGTADRRFQECNLQVRAEPLPPDSDVYKDLEYFLSYMNNGLPVTGPGERP
jgi:sulfur-oxidizing protein SoxA